MKKIAILTCMDVSMRCTGSGCLRACHEKSKGFSRYGEEEIVLISYLHCNGCGADPEQDEGLLKKLNRLQTKGIDVVHTSSCTVRDRSSGIRCAKIDKIADMLQERGIQVVHGTH